MLFAHLKALAIALVLIAISAGIATIAVPEKEKIPVATEPLPPSPLIAAVVIAVESGKEVEMALPAAPQKKAWEMLPKLPRIAAPSPTRKEIWRGEETRATHISRRTRDVRLYDDGSASYGPWRDQSVFGIPLPNEK